jgi:hypothetical protein
MSLILMPDVKDLRNAMVIDIFMVNVELGMTAEVESKGSGMTFYRVLNVPEFPGAGISLAGGDKLDGPGRER